MSQWPLTRLAIPVSMGSESDPRHFFLAQYATSSKLHISITTEDNTGVTCKVALHLPIVVIDFRGIFQKGFSMSLNDVYIRVSSCNYMRGQQD